MSVVLKNISWLFIERVIRILVGFTLNIWIARFLGPDEYGLWNYSIAFVGLVGALATFGIDSVLVRDLINSPEQKEQYMGVAFSLRLFATIISFLFILIVAYCMHPNDTTRLNFIVITSAILFFQIFDIIDYYYQSIAKVREIVIVRNIVFLVSSLMKILFLYYKMPLIYFVWNYVFDYLFIGIGFIFLYTKKIDSVFNWKFDKTVAIKMIKDTAPLMLGNLAIMVYMRIDQVMLGEMTSDKAVGIYSVAVRLIEAFYFVPMMFTVAVFPSIMEAKKISETKYFEKLQFLYTTLTWISLCIAIFITIFATIIINTFYGIEYQKSAIVLIMYSWTLVATYQGVATSQFLTIENLPKISFYRTFIGMLLNIGINYILIPQFEEVGATVATLISYFIVTYSLVIFPKTRSQFLLLLKSYNPVMLFATIKLILQKKA